MNQVPSISVCLIQSNPVWGSCEEYWFWLASTLDSKKFKISLIYPDCEALSTFKELSDRLQLLPQPPSYFQSLRRGLLPLYRLLKKLKPDVVHCNDPGLIGMITASLARVPHRLLTFHTPSQNFNYKLPIKWLQRRLLRHDWQHIVIAQVNKPTVHNRYGVARNKIHVIEYGLESQKFEIADTRSMTRANLNVSLDRVILGCVALLKKQKNHVLLLESYASVLPELKERSHLVLVGDGQLRSALEEQVDRLNLRDNVTFTGYRKDIPQLLQAIDIFVLSSNYEGLPFAVLEAMAMGLPVIATAVDGVRDAIVPGETGILVPPKQVEPLAEAMTQLIKNDSQRHRMGQLARNRFLQNYTLETMVEKIETLYFSICNREGIKLNGGEMK